MEMKEENKIHLEGAKVYGPQDYEVVDELKKLKEENKKLKEENKKLREFKEKREESMFYFKTQMERAEPKTAREAEDLQKAKELFEKLYRKELYHLEQENKNLKETNMDLNSALMVSSAEIVRLKEELKELKEKLNKAGLEEYGFFNEY